MSLNDFVLGRVLHKGSFSTIQIVKGRESGIVFALKSVEKNNKSQPLLDGEKRIRSQNASQWIVGLQQYFEAGNSMYFIMEYLSGGTFVELLQSNGGRMDALVAMFYLGELVLAINAVHCIGYAHRNVKPENILLDGAGHVKLSGFGAVSKIDQDGKVSSSITVDSASYEAPEILSTLGNHNFTYGVECDFWSLGVIAFETITGVHPFASSSPLSAFKKITAKKTKGAVKIPAKLSQECKSFISGLLQEQEDRLKYIDCVSHPFFNDLIWDGLRSEMAPLKLTTRPEEIFVGFGGENAQDENKTPYATGNEDKDTSDVEMLHDDVTRGDGGGNVTFVYPSKLEGASGDKNVGDTSKWSVSAALDPIKEESLTALKKDEDEKLKSELHIKTEQLMEKLHEIQILQTQLQKSSESLKNQQQEVESCKKLNQRLKAELEHVSGALSNEKNARLSLENKLNNMNISTIAARNRSINLNKSDTDSDEMYELKEELIKLKEADGQKEDVILDLNVRLKIVQHELRVQKMENQLMHKRDESSINIYGENYKKDIVELRQKLKQLKESVGGRDNKECSKVKEFIELNEEKLSALPQTIDEIQSAHDSNLKDVTHNRKKIAGLLATIQVGLEKAVQKFGKQLGD